jgi:hypothetical protein
VLPELIRTQQEERMMGAPRITAADVDNALNAFQRKAQATGIMPAGTALMYSMPYDGSSMGLWYMDDDGQRVNPEGLSLHGCTSKQAAWTRITSATRALDAVERASKERMGKLADDVTPQSLRALAAHLHARGPEPLKKFLQEMIVELETLKDQRNPARWSTPAEAESILKQVAGTESTRYHPKMVADFGTAHGYDLSDPEDRRDHREVAEEFIKSGKAPAGIHVSTLMWHLEEYVNGRSVGLYEPDGTTREV